MKCQLCGARLVCLGSLGSKRWFRCSGCGMEIADEIEWYIDDDWIADDDDPILVRERGE